MKAIITAICVLAVLAFALIIGAIAALVDRPGTESKVNQGKTEVFNALQELGEREAARVK